MLQITNPAGSKRTGQEIVGLAPPPDSRFASSSDRARKEGRSTISQEKYTAAKVILAAYRRFVLRRRVPLSGLDKDRSELFPVCYRMAERLKMNTKYRVLFLGPFPHAYVCLQNAYAALITLKKQAVRNMKEGPKEQVQNANAQFNLYT